MWIVLAMLSAGFAALTGIFAKLGMEGINSNLATAIRTVVVLIMAWGIVFLTGKQVGITDITTKGWAYLLLSKSFPSTSSVWFYLWCWHFSFWERK